MSQQPFAGLKVIEFGQFLAVPIAAQLLADGGADVIKVESLAGDPMRLVSSVCPGESRQFIHYNHGKRCLPLALSEDSAKPIMEALIASADVVLMNLRPGLDEKLGIAPEQLLKRYPRLIVGSVSGFGKVGPEASNVGQDIVVQARSGLLAANGRTVDGSPTACDSSTVDMFGAMTLAFGISSALLRRERTGKGGIIETSLLQAGLSLASTSTSTQLTRLDVIDAEEHARKLRELAAKRAEGAPYAEQFEVVKPATLLLLKQMMNVYYTTFSTSDSYVAVACGSHSLQQKFCQAVGVVDEGRSPGFAGDAIEYYKNLAAKVTELMARQSSEYWIALLRKSGVPVSRVFMPIELFEDEHAAANGLFHSFEHPLVGSVTTVAPPLTLDGNGFHPGKPTNPFGSESAAILSELGFSADTIQELMAAGISHRGLQA